MPEDYDDFAYMDDEDDDRITRTVTWVAIALAVATPIILGLAIYGGYRLVAG